MADDGLSIVIPVLNEANVLDQQLTDLKSKLQDHESFEIIVSDGGSTDSTLSIAESHHCTIVTGSTGRAAQLNAGASAANHSWILFLHADTKLPAFFHQQLANAQQWGFFRVQLSGKRPVFRLIESMINWRSSFSGISTGDQAQFFQRDFFLAIGGYPDIPLMEDVAISKKSRRKAAPLVVQSSVITSSRRWENNGVIKTILLMWWLRFAFMVGISANRLHRMYYPQHHG